MPAAYPGCEKSISVGSRPITSTLFSSVTATSCSQCLTEHRHAFDFAPKDVWECHCLCRLTLKAEQPRPASVASGPEDLAQAVCSAGHLPDRRSSRATSRDHG